MHVKTCGKVQSCTAEGKIIHYSCPCPLQREEDLCVALEISCKHIYVSTCIRFRNDSPAWLCEELSGEMKEMKNAFCFARHGVLFHRLRWISQETPSGWGVESAKARYSGTYWGPGPPTEDQMGLCWGRGMGREHRVASSVPAPPDTSLTTLPHPLVPEVFTPHLMTKPTLPSARKNTWCELSLFLAEWILRKWLNLFDSFLHFKKCCVMWKIGTLIPASLALLWDKVLVSDTNQGIPLGHVRYPEFSQKVMEPDFRIFSMGRCCWVKVKR